MSDHDYRQTGGGYNPRYLAQKHGITSGQARDLITEVGHDRERLNLVASKVREARERPLI